MSTPNFMGMGRTELNKYVFSLVGLSIVVLFGLIAIIAGMQTYLSHPRSALAQPEPVVSPTEAPQKANAHPAAFPRATVADWGKLPPPSFSPPVRTTLYALKQQYNRLEFANLAQHFIPVVDDKVTESDKSVSVVSDTAGVFYLYKPTGAFFYKSDAGVTLPQAGPTEREKVNEFMRTVWNDSTLQVTGSFEKKSSPGVTYYELHRDWDKVGLPIVNLIGTFNIAETERFGSLSLTKPPVSIASPDIIKTDNQTDGVARADDFNTATVGVVGGKIVSVTSNIRPVNPQGTRSHEIISYDGAVSNLKNGGYVYLYTSPAGEGSANADMLYQSNAVALENVQVKESFAAYIEDLPSAPQTHLYPYFIFRGQAQSHTGYRVNFIAAVSAVSDSVLGASTSKDIRLLSQNGSKSSQQQGTFEFVEPTDAPLPALSQPVGYTPSPIMSQGQEKPLTCNPPPSPGDLENIITNANGQSYGQFQPTAGSLSTYVRGNDSSPIRRTYSREWYVLPSGGWDVNALQSAVNTVWDDLKTIPGSERQRRLAMVITEYAALGTGCPLRVTGASPSIFVYGHDGESISVHSGATLTYSDPPARGNRWVGRMTSDYIYYEYEPVKFERPDAGWNVARRDLATLVDRVAHELSLNDQERARLITEVNNAAAQVRTTRLFVGIIPQSQIDAKIPLTVENTPVVRYHFYVGGAEHGVVAPPVLSPLVRKNSIAVEVGALAP
ncbi:hypothetical protein HYS00_03825 [Candidatus Microgenomates bacterium]|nr:hypothetical protein [Candidatus Microgenomates bacterium]